MGSKNIQKFQEKYTLEIFEKNMADVFDNVLNKT